MTIKANTCVNCDGTINRDELKKNLQYALEHLVIDYDSMNYDQIKALDESLDAIFGIVEKLIREEERNEID